MAKIGSDQITLIDVTDSVSLRLDLICSQSLLQIKKGDKYSPDYGQENQKITPILYKGNVEIDVSDFLKKITYTFGGENYIYLESGENNGEGRPYVDNTASLIIRKNLEKDETVLVSIKDIENSSITETLSLNLITSEDGYTAEIINQDGRYDFHDGSSDSIILEAKLYSGSTEIINGLEYQWYNLSGEIAEAESNILEIKRDSIASHENFSCKISYEGISFYPSRSIDDRTDNYVLEIISDIPVLTPIKNRAELTAKVFKNANTEIKDNVSYSWAVNSQIVKDENGNDITGSKIVITTGEVGESNVLISCSATINGKEKAVNSYVLPYSSRDITFELETDSIFVNVDPENDKVNKDFSKTIKYSIKDMNSEISDNDYNYDLKIAPELKDDKRFIFSVNKKDKEIAVSLNKQANDYTMEEDNLSFTITASIEGTGYTSSKTITLIKTKQGRSVATYNAVLSNDYHLFAGQEVSAFPGQTTSFYIDLYYGDQKIKLENLEINGMSIEEGKNNSITSENLFPGLKITREKESGKDKITLETLGAETTEEKLMKGGTLQIKSSAEYEGINLLFISYFTYGINLNGASYFIVPNTNQIIYRNSDQTYEPSILTFEAYYTKDDNQANDNIPFSNGRLFYQTDLKKEWTEITTKSGDSNIYSLDISNFEKFNSLSVRLFYGEPPSGNYDKFLETETLNVLVSLEGQIVGGTNLLPNTKDLPTGHNSWYLVKKDSKVSIEKDLSDDFNYCNFSEVYKSNSWVSIRSPRIKLSKSFIGSFFTYSCLVYAQDWDEIFKENCYDLIMSIGGHSTPNTINRNCYHSFKKNELKQEELGKSWRRLSITFKLTNELMGSYDSSSFEEKTNLEDCNYLSVGFFLKIIKQDSNATNNIIQFKKPKLEMGNVPTDWSANPYDISLEDVEKVNLISQDLNPYSLELTSDYLCLKENLTVGQTYTFSFKNDDSDLVLSTDGPLYYSFSGKTDEETSLNNNFLTFTVEKDKSAFYLKSTKNLSLREAKLEVGSTPSSFFLTQAEYETLMEDIAKRNEGKFPFTVEMGGEDNNCLIITDLNSSLAEAPKYQLPFLNSFNNLNDDVTRIKGTIETLSDTYIGVGDGYITQLQKSIIFSTEGGSDSPYIEIKTEQTSSENDSPSSSSSSLKLEAERLVFMTNNNEVAYLSNEKLYITEAEFIKGLRIGAKEAGGFLVFRHTETGVVAVWEVE